MSDLISRQAAIDVLDTGLWGVEWDKALATAMLKDLPSAEPERKKGKWLDDHGNEKKDGYGADCSVCGWWSEYLTDFCGSCGADMRGGEDATD